jgi:23S rRNA pseudouridine2605 synthase
MMRAINHPVVELERVEIGPLSLGRLKRGSFRELTPEEVASLRRYVGLAD